MKSGDPLIVWSQLTQGLRRAVFVEDAGDQVTSSPVVDHNTPVPSFRFVFERESTTYSRSYASEGVLWIKGDDLDSPGAHALLTAFHLLYRLT